MSNRILLIKASRKHIRRALELLEDYTALQPTPQLMDILLPSVNKLLEQLEACFDELTDAECEIEASEVYDTKRKLERFKAVFYQKVFCQPLPFGNNPFFSNLPSLGAFGGFSGGGGGFGNLLHQRPAQQMNHQPLQPSHRITEPPVQRIFISFKDAIYTRFCFKPNAPLKNYLVHKNKKIPEPFTLLNILLLLKEIIIEEKLFDPRNVSIILCNPELDKALNKKALHITELHWLVLFQMRKMCCQTTESLDNTKLPEQCSDFKLYFPEKPKPTEGDSASLFSMQHLLRSILSVANGSNGMECKHKQCLFTKDEITKLVLSYLKTKHTSLTDPRNPYIFFVKNDPIGWAFQVDAFHESQIPSLIQKQIIPQK